MGYYLMLFLVGALAVGEVQAEVQDFDLDCVLLVKTQRVGTRYQLEFLNTCDDSVHLKVCINTGRFEPTELKSFMKIPEGGRIQMMVPPGEVPYDIMWNSDPDDPDTPAPCEVIRRPPEKIQY